MGCGAAGGRWTRRAWVEPPFGWLFPDLADRLRLVRLEEVVVTLASLGGAGFRRGAGRVSPIFGFRGVLGLRLS